MPSCVVKQIRSQISIICWLRVVNHTVVFAKCAKSKIIGQGRRDKMCDKIQSIPTQLVMCPIGMKECCVCAIYRIPCMCTAWPVMTGVRIPTWRIYHNVQFHPEMS
jgi:hypothetical protein